VSGPTDKRPAHLRFAPNLCLFCKAIAPYGEWHCITCEERCKRRATPEEEARMTGKPPPTLAGNIEQQQYSLARPLAVGRVGPFLRLT